MKIFENLSKENKTVVFLHRAIRIIIIISFISFLYRGDWLDATLTMFIFILMIIPNFLKRKYNLYIPLELDFAIVLFIFLTSFLGSLNRFYLRFDWWDGLLHFMSGLLLGVIGFLLVYLLNERKTEKLTMSPGFVSFFAFCFSVALAGIWEIYEFFGDLWFGLNMQESGLPDTMGDILVNTIGALIVCSVGYMWMKKRNKLPFTPY